MHSDIQGDTASGREEILHDRKWTIVSGEEATDVSVNEAAADEAAINEAVADEAAINEVAVNEVAVTEAAVNEVAVNEAAVNEAAASEAAAVTEAVADEAAINEAATNENGSESEIPYCYCFIRTDIPIEDQMVQIGHACLEAGKRFQHPDNTHIVLLALKSEGRLIENAGFL